MSKMGEKEKEEFKIIEFRIQKPELKIKRLQDYRKGSRKKCVGGLNGRMKGRRKSAVRVKIKLGGEGEIEKSE